MNNKIIMVFAILVAVLIVFVLSISRPDKFQPPHKLSTKVETKKQEQSAVSISDSRKSVPSDRYNKNLAEQTIRNIAKEQYDFSFSKLSCPDSVVISKGKIFRCNGVVETDKVVIKAKITDETSGGFTWEIEKINGKDFDQVVRESEE